VHITHLDQAPRFARILATQCPRLRHLHIRDGAASAPSLSARWGSVDYVPIWQGRWTEKEVRGSRWFEAMRVLSGLGSVSLAIGEDESLPIFTRSLGEKEVLRANVGLAERLFVESATRPRDSAAAREESPVGRVRVPKRS
jgi:hypothetical protein